MQAELIELNSSEASSSQQSPTSSHAPSHAPGPFSNPSQPNSTAHTPRGSSPHGSDTQASIQQPGAESAASAAAADEAQSHSSNQPADCTVSALTRRSSGSQSGTQSPTARAQKGSNMKGAVSGELSAMGRRKGSGRAAARQTSEELPDVTGRQSDHTIFDATGIRRVSTAGRRIFGSSS